MVFARAAAANAEWEQGGRVEACKHPGRSLLAPYTYRSKSRYSARKDKTRRSLLWWVAAGCAPRSASDVGASCSPSLSFVRSLIEFEPA